MFRLILRAGSVTFFAASFAANVAIAQGSVDAIPEEVTPSEEAAMFRRVIALLEEEISFLEDDLSSLSALREAEDSELDRVRDEADDLEVRVADLARVEEAAVSRVAALHAQQEQLAYDVQATRAAIFDREEQADTQVDLTVLDAQKDALLMEINDLQAEREVLQQDLEALHAEMEEMRIDGAQAWGRQQTELSALALDLTTARDALRDAEAARSVAEARLLQIQALLEVATSELAELAAAEAMHREALDASTTELAASQAALVEVQSAKVEALQELEERRMEIAGLEEARDRARARLSETQAEVSDVETDLAAITAIREGVQSDIAAGQSALDEITADLRASEALHDALAEELSVFRTSLAEAEAESMRVNEDFATSRAALEGLRAEIQQESQRLDGLHDEGAAWDRRIAERSTEMASLESNVSAFNAEQQSAVASLNTAVSEAVVALLEANSELAALNEVRERRAAEIEQFGNQIASARTDLSGLESRRTALAEEVADLEQVRAARSPERSVRQEEALENNAERGADVTIESNVAVGRDPLPARLPVQAPVLTHGLRSPTMVEQALQTAPGLPSRNSTEVRQLRDLLINGACPTDALRETFGTINRQTLVALVRILGTCGG